MKKNDLPAMPFYVGDWRKAPDIRALTLEERGLWFEMLCIMWECPRRGFLSLNGKDPIDDDVLGRMVGEHSFVITKIKQVLQQQNIFSIEEGTGIVYNRRMVKDEEIRVYRSVAGTKGMKSRYSDIGACYNKTANKKLTRHENEIEYENEDDVRVKRDGTEKKESATDTSARSSSRFTKPTVEDVDAYCRDRNNKINASAFIDFYDSKGWRIGSQPMRDWRAAIRTWERRQQASTTKKPDWLDGERELR